MDNSCKAMCTEKRRGNKLVQTDGTHDRRKRNEKEAAYISYEHQPFTCADGGCFSSTPFSPE